MIVYKYTRKLSMRKTYLSLLHLIILFSFSAPLKVMAQTIGEFLTADDTASLFLIVNEQDDEKINIIVKDALSNMAKLIASDRPVAQEIGFDKEKIPVPICELYPELCAVDTFVLTEQANFTDYKNDADNPTPEYLVPICALYPRFCAFSVPETQADLGGKISLVAEKIRAGVGLYSGYDEYEWKKAIGLINNSVGMLINPAKILINKNNDLIVASDGKASIWVAEDASSAALMEQDDPYMQAWVSRMKRAGVVTEYQIPSNKSGLQILRMRPQDALIVKDMK